MHRLRLRRDTKQTRKHWSKATRIRFSAVDLCVCVEGSGEEPVCSRGSGRSLSVVEGVGGACL